MLEAAARWRQPLVLDAQVGNAALSRSAFLSNSNLFGLGNRRFIIFRDL
jgi:hypothetical protein